MKTVYIVAYLVFGLTGQSSGFLDALLSLLGGGRGRSRLRMGRMGSFGGIGFMGPIIPRRRRVFDHYDRDHYREDPYYHDCQEPGAPKCRVGYECVTVSSIKSGEEHLCTRNHVGHCECAAGCMHKNRFIPMGSHRKPVEVDTCEWCQCLQHHDHAHADCFRDCNYNAVHEDRQSHSHH